MRAVYCCAGALGALLLAGCVHERSLDSAAAAAPDYSGASASTPDSSRKMIVTPEQGLEGTVAWVNANLRFVVITFPVGQVPAVDRRLFVYRSGLKVGEVKITGPQREDNIVGDIVAGEAAVGDTARDR